MVRTWNPTINLVSTRDLDRLAERHVSDSLRLLPHLPIAPICLADLGAGAGFPGLVLAIATGWPVILVESDRRKASFLRQAAHTLDCRVTVHTARIEELPSLRAELITARALAPLDTLLGYAHRHLRDGGTCLFLKGARWEAELSASASRWSFQAEPFADPAGPGVVLRVAALRPC